MVGGPPKPGEYNIDIGENSGNMVQHNFLLVKDHLGTWQHVARKIARNINIKKIATQLTTPREGK